jgi:hypothetical protein
MLQVIKRSCFLHLGGSCELSEILGRQIKWLLKKIVVDCFPLSFYSCQESIFMAHIKKALEKEKI